MLPQEEERFEDFTSYDAPVTPGARAARRASILQRLEAYRILPPAHDRLDDRVLELVEQLFVTWFELGDDGSRRAAVSYLFASECDLRATILAIVPLYYDALFFDDFTPTRDLIEIALVAHAKWRRWLTGDSSSA